MFPKPHIVALSLVVAALAAPGAAYAQDQSDPSSKATVHLGRVSLLPVIALTNMGVDNNVFNDPTNGTPKSDFTMTTQAKTDAWLHMRRSILSVSISEDFVYYQTYSNQRSVNGAYSAGLAVPLTRVSFKLNAGYINAKDRPGFEIDARLPRAEVAFDSAVEFRASAKTFVGVRAAHQLVQFGADAAFGGANIRNELNRTTASQAVTLRYRLTPLTTLIVDAGKQQDRFEFNPLRDADSTTLVVGALFDRFALLKGSARFGIRHFRPLVTSLPNYDGSTAAVDLSYVARGVTRLSLAGVRDVYYSYDVNQPYYVQTGATLSISQQVYGQIDVLGRAGVQRLAYRDRVGASPVFGGRTDTVHTYQIGAGYRLGRATRLGLNVDKQHRASPFTARTYDNLRFGIAVTYEF